MSDTENDNPEIDIPQASVKNPSSGVDSSSSSGTSTSAESVMSAAHPDQAAPAMVATSSTPEEEEEEDDDHYSPKYEPEATSNEDHDDENVDDLLVACSGDTNMAHQPQPEHPAATTVEANCKPTAESSPAPAASESLQQILQSLASHGQSTASGSNGNAQQLTNEPVPESEIKAPLSEEESNQFAEYRRVESEYINSGNWDKFPIGSRMFIGNLPGDRIDTVELFKLFNKYGRLAQISIKRAYGFVQYFSPEDCERAMKTENGRYLRGCYLKLEVAQPQAKNRERRRSVSPNGYSRSQDGFRSRSPGGNDNDRGDRGRLRRHDLLSRRKPHIIPEVQIVMESRVDRDFIFQIERPIKHNGMSVNYQWLQPRALMKDVLPDIVNQLIRERVFGLVIVERIHQQVNKVNLQVFHPAPDGGVRFDEYQMIDIPVAVELLGRVKREKMATLHSHTISQPQMSPAIPPVGNVGYYGGIPLGSSTLPGMAGGAMANPATIGIPTANPMNIPMAIPTLPNDHTATLLALQSQLDTVSFQKVALALQQQAVMQQHPQQSAFMQQPLLNMNPNSYTSPPASVVPTPKPRHNSNGNHKGNYPRRGRDDRSVERAGPLPYGPVSNRPLPSAYVPQHVNRKSATDPPGLYTTQNETVTPSSPQAAGQSVKGILDQLANLRG